MSRSHSSEMAGPHVSDTRAPLISTGGGRGEAPACCACLARALAGDVQRPRLVWTTGELQGLAWAPTQQRGLVPSPWERSGEDGGSGGRGGWWGRVAVTLGRQSPSACEIGDLGQFLILLLVLCDPQGRSPLGPWFSSLLKARTFVVLPTACANVHLPSLTSTLLST